MLLPLAVCLHSQPAAAFSWSDLWQRPDQQARAALDAGHAQQAQALARDPALRGAAAYRAGDFAAAAQDFELRSDVDAQYNHGNALAKQGQYEQAIAAYAAALAGAPGMADAVANKQAVEDLLKKQQKDQKQQNKQDSKDHQGKQQDGSGDPSADKSQDQNKQDQDKPDQDKPDQSRQNGQGQPQSQQGKDPSQPDESQQNQPQQNSSAGKHNDSGSDKNTSAQASAKEADQQAQLQFQQNMDQALKQEGKPDAKPDERKTPTVRLGGRDDGSTQDGSMHDEHRQAVEQWLQRVPDDPGGLLRRKFQLEYQRRQHGDNGHGDEDR